MSVVGASPSHSGTPPRTTKLDDQNFAPFAKKKMDTPTVTFDD